MSPAEIPSKPHLHHAFMTALKHRVGLVSLSSPLGTHVPAAKLSSQMSGRVLDLGCGDGRLALQLADELAAEGALVEWVGADVCSEAVDHARLLAKQRGVRVRARTTGSCACRHTRALACQRLCPKP